MKKNFNSKNKYFLALNIPGPCCMSRAGGGAGRCSGRAQDPSQPGRHTGSSLRSARTVLKLHPLIPKK